MVEVLASNAVVSGEKGKDWLGSLKIALIKAKVIISKGLPAGVVWRRVLEEAAEKMGGHKEVIKQLLGDKFKLAEILKWYLSAQFSSNEIFRFMGQAEVKDLRIIRAMTVCNPWSGYGYRELSDTDVMNYILTNGWSGPRKMRGLIEGNFFDNEKNLEYVADVCGDDWTLEMLAKCGCLNEKIMGKLLVLPDNQKNETSKKFNRRFEFVRIWQCWSERGISETQKIQLCRKAFRTFGLIEVLRQVIKDEEQIVAGLLASKMTLPGIAAEYVVKKFKHIQLPTGKLDKKGQLIHANVSVIKMIKIDPIFIGILEKHGKTEEEIVGILVEGDIGLEVMAFGLAEAGWSADRIIRALIQNNCNPSLILRMIREGEEDFEWKNNDFWDKDTANQWRQVLNEVIASQLSQIDFL